MGASLTSASYTADIEWELQTLGLKGDSCVFTHYEKLNPKHPLSMYRVLEPLEPDFHKLCSHGVVSLRFFLLLLLTGVRPMPPCFAFPASKVRSKSIFFLLLRPTLLSFHPKMVQRPIRNQTRFRFWQRSRVRCIRCCENLPERVCAGSE